jgi:hypothetical protein
MSKATCKMVAFFLITGTSPLQPASCKTLMRLRAFGVAFVLIVFPSSNFGMHGRQVGDPAIGTILDDTINLPEEVSFSATAPMQKAVPYSLPSATR